MRLLLPTVGLLATLLSAACTSSREAGTPPTSTSALLPDKPLLNTRWILQRLGPDAVPPAEDAQALDLLLRLEVNTVQGNAGCNRFRGTYTRTGSDQLTFSQLISTKRACPQLTTESQYLTALDATTRYQIHGDTLRLFGAAATQPLARFLVAGQ